jgi:hypothetical protein
MEQATQNERIRLLAHLDSIASQIENVADATVRVAAETLAYPGATTGPETDAEVWDSWSKIANLAMDLHAMAVNVRGENN